MNLLIAIIGALAAGTAAVLLRHGHINTIGGAIQLSIITAVGVFGAAALITTIAPALKQPTANYELETGEYLQCTPQDGTTLTCTIEHREKNQ